MKYLLLFLLAISFVSRASLYIPLTAIGTCDTIFARKSQCTPQPCLDISDINCHYAKATLEEIQVDDFMKPLYSTTVAYTCIERVSTPHICVAIEDDPETEDIDESLTAEDVCSAITEPVMYCPTNSTATLNATSITCTTSIEQDCSNHLASTTCESPAVLTSGQSELVCKTFLGYEQKTVQNYIAVIDTDLKTAYEAQLQIEVGVRLAQERMEHGKKTMALLIYRNSLKTLTQEQIATMLSNYSSIKSLLETGSLNTAKTAIEALTVDGVIITEEDKAALITHIESYANL